MGHGETTRVGDAGPSSVTLRLCSVRGVWEVGPRDAFALWPLLILGQAMLVGVSAVATRLDAATGFRRPHSSRRLPPGSPDFQQPVL